MKRKASLLALILACLLPLNAQAHRTWLLPSSTVVEGKEPWVTVDAAVSENLFDFGANALKLDGLAISGPDGSALVPDNVFTGRLRSSFDLKLPRPGTYKLSLVTENVMASYKQAGEAKRWRGTVEAFTREIPSNAEELRSTRTHSRLETFITSGNPNNTALEPSGTGLEMVPITHPNELAVDAKASFRFLFDGKPAAHLQFSVIPGGVRYRGVLKEMRLVTDAEGRATITWPEAGMYWISASFPPPPPAGAPQAPQVERRATYAATLEVLPE